MALAGTFVEHAIRDKLEALNKGTLRFILGDYSSLYTTLLSKVNSTLLCNKRVQNFLIFLYESKSHCYYGS